MYANLLHLLHAVRVQCAELQALAARRETLVRYTIENLAALVRRPEPELSQRSNPLEVEMEAQLRDKVQEHIYLSHCLCTAAELTLRHTQKRVHQTSTRFVQQTLPPGAGNGLLQGHRRGNILAGELPPAAAEGAATIPLLATETQGRSPAAGRPTTSSAQ